MEQSLLNSEKELLTRVAKGDELAFRQFFDAYKERLYVFVENIVYSHADAEEIIQDSFLAIWKAGDRLLEVEHPGKYLFTIARNNTLNHLKKIARNQELVKQIWANWQQFDNSLELTIQSKELQESIENALVQLSDQKQAIFRLSRDKGLSHEEIATMLGLSKSRVKNILVEVLKFLKTSLQDKHGFGALCLWIYYYEKLF